MKLEWTRTLLAVLAAFLLLGGAVACGPDEEEVEEAPVVTEAPVATDAVEVTTVDFGTEIDANNQVVTPTTTFSADDTIYVSVATDGTAAGETLAARWVYEDGQEVDRTEETLTGEDRVYEFHLDNPDGWPAGTYTVEITLDGRQVASRTFTVA